MKTTNMYTAVLSLSAFVYSQTSAAGVFDNVGKGMHALPATVAAYSPHTPLQTADYVFAIDTALQNAAIDDGHPGVSDAAEIFLFAIQNDPQVTSQLTTIAAGKFPDVLIDAVTFAAVVDAAEFEKLVSTVAELVPQLLFEIALAVQQQAPKQIPDLLATVRIAHPNLADAIQMTLPLLPQTQPTTSPLYDAPPPSPTVPESRASPS